MIYPSVIVCNFYNKCMIRSLKYTVFILASDMCTCLSFVYSPLGASEPSEEIVLFCSLVMSYLTPFISTHPDTFYWSRSENVETLTLFI